MTEPASFLPQTETKVPIVQGPGEGKSVGVLGDQTTFKVLSEQTGGAYAILEQQIPAGHGPPLHVHRHETEIFYILEGEFEFTVGEKRLIVQRGTTLVAPRDIPHTFQNVSKEVGKLHLTIIPGNFANYFLEVDQQPDNDLASIRRLCAKYDVEILQ
ncbi:Cupin domain protein [Planctomycetes bacterium Pan216]|uniref:Cupin domain protein n=1 Tax=Kolteria novifilia TaxID=2527975 RepID=A0A518B4W0_9BACT|nr:Cupin domain protein [Planctomycetes bacterium Pan216]